MYNYALSQSEINVLFGNYANDTTAPTISLTGSSTINLTVGDTFTDPGATATDNVDGDLTSSIAVSGIVDTSTAGTYVVTYSVSDAAGNTSTVDRTIVVNTAYSTYTINIRLSGRGSGTGAGGTGSDATGSISGYISSQQGGNGLLMNLGDTLIIDNTLEDGSIGNLFYVNTYSQSGNSGNTADAQVVTDIDAFRKSFKPNTTGTFYIWVNSFPSAEVVITVQ
jgi:hypothetical protein